MAKTKHPKEVIENAGKTLQAENFNISGNDEANDKQASITYKVTANEGSALGVGGETLGFGKPMITAKLPEKTFKQSSNKSTIKGIFATESPEKSKQYAGDYGLVTRQVASYQADKLLGLNSVSEERLGVDSNGKFIGISMQADGRNVLSNSGVMQVDCTDPRIQRGLSDLEVSDFITGQIDRHAGNIFIDPATGKVTGIDNDLSFPEVPTEQAGTNVRERIVGMPRMMHAETRDKILAADPEALRAKLSTPGPEGGPSPLSEKAIDGAVGRLRQLQAELRKENSAIKVVGKFDAQTYREAIETQDQALKAEQAFWTQNLHERDKLGWPFPLDSPPGMSQYLTLSEQQREALPMTMTNCLGTSVKTSYLGTAELEKTRSILHGDKQLEQTVAGPAARSSQATLEKELADGYQKMSPSQQKDFDRDLEKLNRQEETFDAKLKHLEKHREKPSPGDYFKALRTLSSVEKVMEREQEQVDGLKSGIDRLKEGLKQKVDAATMSVSSGEIGHSTGDSTTSNQVDVRPQLKQASMEIASEGERSELEQSGMEIASEGERSELEQPKPKLNGTPSTKDGALNKGVEGMESGEHSLEQEKPKVERRMSVRDSMSSESQNSKRRSWEMGQGRDRSSSRSTGEDAGFKIGSGEREEGSKQKLVLSGSRRSM